MSDNINSPINDHESNSFVGPSLELIDNNNEILNDLSVCKDSTNSLHISDVSIEENFGPTLDLIEIIKETGDSAPSKKRRKLKGCEFADIYLKYLPKASYYQLSYMHRAPLTHVQFSKTGYLITTSIDGNLNIWKKGKVAGLDFVKRFRAHLDSILDITISNDGEYCATIGADKTIKVFDVLNCDMINMIKLAFLPYCCCWIYAETDSTRYLAVSEADSKNIYIANVFEKNGIVKNITDLHDSVITNIIYNSKYEAIVSFDSDGMIEYWTGVKYNYEFPKNLNWKFKTDTDLYELFKKKTSPIAATIASSGEIFAVYSCDRQIRIFNFLRGKLITVIDESIQMYIETDQIKEIASMELGRRLAVEKELERNEFKYNFNLEFDTSSNLLIYSTLMGIKIVDVFSKQVYRVLGTQENIRLLNIAVSPVSATTTTDTHLLLVPGHDSDTVEDKEMKMPLIVATAYKRNRFYLFTNDEPIQTTDAEGNVEIDRDMLNEKPTKEEIISASDTHIALKKATSKAVENVAVLHTSYGDIHLQLYPQLCPKTVENFVGHSKSGYYNGRIFHRVIKNFMIQSGCPFGNGSGGQSIWGGDFEDEFHPTIKQDKPYLLCMANTGEKNSNGSQFFITLKPCPWLENKHTIFGKAIKGMDVIQKITSVPTDKNDKPLDDIVISSVTIKHVS